MATITDMKQNVLLSALSAQPVPGLDISKYPKLSREQAGHIRHIHNLAPQPDGSWHHMGSLEPMQGFLDAYPHYHRLPALRGTFKPLIRQLIHKMLRREVWGYWFNTSYSGVATDPGLEELRKPWADSVVREDIMYSGHLLLMTSLYAMLFNDNEFEKPDSLVFDWDPLFLGLGPERFSYDNRSLQKAILAEMERNNCVGVCCEPNAVFVVCNQFPIIAMRYNDVRDGTNIVSGVLEKYKAAWDAKGMVQPDGLFVDWLLVKQQLSWPPLIQFGAGPPREIGFTAWAGAYMHAWNYDINNEIRLRPLPVANAFRHLVTDRSLPADSEDTLITAIEASKTLPLFPIRFNSPTFGCVAQWLSELGKKDELDGLLLQADRDLNPTWENVGRFYPRNDVQDPATEARWTHMDPFSGNAGIGYARLNVPEGQRIMWENPWTRETWDGSVVGLRPVARNLAPGKWAVYVNGSLREIEEVGDGSNMEIEVRVGGEEADVVFIKL
ncbi:hypothetical protein BDV40DRAFT_290574 [Aspergillus tamarii]|uniref:Linalool dehydratase/isomerase domain-containing protein n=1 Tax=Aspergillus tamarii TaxID=41984 RepID=A0A5N6UMQ1_ASPTM|nr:hypothetical protein BDV40DRAFT_290574 [Aspergillus tamarii]